MLPAKWWSINIYYDRWVVFHDNWGIGTINVIFPQKDILDCFLGSICIILLKLYLEITEDSVLHLSRDVY